MGTWIRLKIPSLRPQNHTSVSESCRYKGSFTIKERSPLDACRISNGGFWKGEDMFGGRWWCWWWCRKLDLKFLTWRSIIIRFPATTTPMMAGARHCIVIIPRDKAKLHLTLFVRLATQFDSVLFSCSLLSDEHIYTTRVACWLCGKGMCENVCKWLRLLTKIPVVRKASWSWEELKGWVEEGRGFSTREVEISTWRKWRNPGRRIMLDSNLLQEDEVKNWVPRCRMRTPLLMKPRESKRGLVSQHSPFSALWPGWLCP